MKKETIKSLFSNTLEGKKFLGEVLNVNDPQQEGKIKVRVFSLFDEFEEESIPWALPRNHFTSGNSTGSGFYSLPKLNSIVQIEFDNGNPYLPCWSSLDRISRPLKDRITGTEEETDYNNAQSILFDTETNTYIYSIPSEGLFIRRQSDTESGQQLWLKNVGDDLSVVISNSPEQIIEIKSEDNTINITNNSQNILMDGETNEITINQGDGNLIYSDSSEILLGSDSAKNPAVKFEEFSEGFEKFLDELNKHMNQIASAGIVTPVGPGNAPSATGVITAISKLKIDIQKMKSNIVKLKE